MISVKMKISPCFKNNVITASKTHEVKEKMEKIKNDIKIDTFFIIQEG